MTRSSAAVEVFLGSQIEKNYADATPVVWIAFALMAAYVAFVLVKKRRGKR